MILCVKVRQCDSDSFMAYHMLTCLSFLLLSWGAHWVQTCCAAALVRHQIQLLRPMEEVNEEQTEA